MRVWHPDRFQGDERLRKKAEEQAQRINSAMSELRKLGKDGLERARSATQQSSSRPAPDNQRNQNYQHGTQTRSQFHTQNESHGAAHAQREHSRHEASRGSFQFAIAPLLVRPKFGTTLFRVAAACFVAYLAYESLLRPSKNPQQEAFTLAIIFTALDFGVRNLLSVIVPGPVVAVDKSGLFLMKIGRLTWTDFESVWPVMTPRFSNLSVRFSRHYIKRQNPLLQAFLLARRWFTPAHVVIPFNGLNANPIQVVDAMKLFQLHNQMVIEEDKPADSRILLALHCIAFIACAFPMLRCLRDGGLFHLEYIAYFVVFVACRIGDFILRRARVRF